MINLNLSRKSLLLSVSLVPAALMCIVGFTLHGSAILRPAAQRGGESEPTVASNGEVARVRSGVAALGKQWNGTVKAETAKLYLPLHKSHNNSGIKQMRDLSYGPHAQQKLDLFAPDQGFNDLSPVFVFLHEGADKIVTGSGELLYSNVAKWIARFGGVGINANFRMPRDAASGIRSRRCAHGG